MITSIPKRTEEAETFGELYMKLTPCTRVNAQHMMKWTVNPPAKTELLSGIGRRREKITNQHQECQSMRVVARDEFGATFNCPFDFHDLLKSKHRHKIYIEDRRKIKLNKIK